MLGMLGRMCLSLVFILAAVNKIIHWDETQQGLMRALSDFIGHLTEMGGIDRSMEHYLARLVSWVPIVVTISVVAELVGGLLVFFDTRKRLGAFFLLIFLIPTTVLMHPFWWAAGQGREFEMEIFLKNISICGGLLLLLAGGSQAKFSKKTSKTANDSK